MSEEGADWHRWREEGRRLLYKRGSAGLEKERAFSSNRQSSSRTCGATRLHLWERAQSAQGCVYGSDEQFPSRLWEFGRGYRHSPSR